MAAHRGRDMVVVSSGPVVSERPFDIHSDDITQIDPLSLASRMTHGRELYVPIRTPERSLPVNIVAHSDPLERHDPQEILLGRKILTRELQNSLEDALPQDDRINFFVVGQRDPHLVEPWVDYLEGTEEPLAAAHAVADLCRDGLTIVISTFKNLPLEQAQKHPRAAVAVKVNHQWDLQLQPDTGTHDTGEPTMPVVHTNMRRGGKPNPELLAYRVLQEQRHEETMERLKRAGLVPMYAVFDKQKAPDFADSKVIDVSLARAVRLAARRRR
jgi:hypothetical protein